MSEKICSVAGVDVTAYVGEQRVPMVQLTGGKGVVQLSLEQFRELSMRVFAYAVQNSKARL